MQKEKLSEALEGEANNWEYPQVRKSRWVAKEKQNLDEISRTHGSMGDNRKVVCCPSVVTKSQASSYKTYSEVRIYTE